MEGIGMKAIEVLEDVAKFMTEYKGVPYSVKCFYHQVSHVGIGTHSDEPVEYYPSTIEGVIAVVRDDFDVENMF